MLHVLLPAEPDLAEQEAEVSAAIVDIAFYVSVAAVVITWLITRRPK